MLYPGIPMEKLCAFLEVSAKSPQKKLNMFLRWMIRRDSEVDLGIWESFDRRDLIVPLDTHVCRVAHYFKLTDTETFSLEKCPSDNGSIGYSSFRMILVWAILLCSAWGLNGEI